MRQCGGCTLCCRVMKIAEPDFQKPANVWCKHCHVGKGCKVYEEQPLVCSKFKCLWLTDMTLTEEERPDRVGFFVTMEGPLAKVNCDPERDDQWRGEGLLTRLREKHHIVMQQGLQVTFMPSYGLSMPEKLVLDWSL